MRHHPKSEFLHVMQTRGFVADITDWEGLDEALCSGSVPAYIGFDATAKSLHVGSLMQIMMLRWLQKTGHKPLVLMGGGTTKVGDPSFRANERPLLPETQIRENIKGIKQVFQKYLSFDGASAAVILNNADWLDKLGYIDFLREVGRHFSVNRMLSFESVKSRLSREQCLSFLEFNYMILQAYDFMELNRRHGCLLQIGGSDQWGNIVNGIELSRRMSGQEVFGLTSPLLTTADGRKMGKTSSGAVWLNDTLCSPYIFWQFWRNTADQDVGRFLKLFTEIPIDECERLGALAGSEINEAKIRLANAVTTLAHGEDAAKSAEETAWDVFEEEGIGRDLPHVNLDWEDIKNTSPAQLFARTKLVKSGKEAKHLFAGQGARTDETLLDISSQSEPLEDFVEKFKPNFKKKSHIQLKLSAGKKRHVIVNIRMDKPSSQR